MKVTDGPLIPRGYERVTNVSAAVGITRDTDDKKRATLALIKAETQSVRWRDDGSNPTAAIGMLLDVGDEFWYSGDLAAIKFIETAASASLHISLYQ